MASTNTLSFNPTDEELILRFLANKVNGKPLPNDATNNIRQCDDLLYGEKKPWEIWDVFGGGDNGMDELYFFTIKRKKSSYLVGTNIGMGLWEAENKGRGRTIVAKGTHTRIGRKRICLWIEKNGSGTNHDGAWIMHEYSLHSSLLCSPYYANNYVLCKLIKNHRDHVQQKIGSKQSARLRTLATAASTNNNGGLGDIQERPTKSKNEQLLQAEDGDERIKVDETTATTQFNYEEHVGTKEKPLILQEEEEEEDIQLIPNPFAMDLLLERIDDKHFGSSN